VVMEKLHHRQRRENASPSRQIITGSGYKVLFSRGTTARRTRAD
jgi:hypothetical protein